MLAATSRLSCRIRIRGQDADIEYDPPNATAEYELPPIFEARSFFSFLSLAARWPLLVPFPFLLPPRAPPRGPMRQIDILPAAAG